MKVKALIFGAAIGFLLATVQSCGGSTCGPNNCGGCCDSKGACVPRSASNSNSTCGWQGQACVDCTKTGQTCNPTTYVCEGGSTGGGTGGGATGGGSGGGATGGGTGGGATGGGTGGGATGGGTGGGATGGGSGGGSASCNYQAQDCSTGACVIANSQGTAFACLGGECSIRRQDCPDAGACVFAPGGAAGVQTACTAAGTRQVGETCGQGIGNCVAGSVCAGPQGGPTTCVKFCFGNPGDCPPGYACSGGVRITTSAFMFICQPECDLLEQDCPNNEACYPTNQGNVCFTAGAGGSGAACTSADDCQRGFGCFGTGAGGACRQFCNLDGGSPSCPDGGVNSCVMVQGLGIGACAG
jgi:hypothetical protein